VLNYDITWKRAREKEMKKFLHVPNDEDESFPEEKSRRRRWWLA
jgi:hypothetical protein